MEDPSKWVYESDQTDTEPKYDIKKHEQQRATRGFSTYDFWNFDSYLSYVIIGGIKLFREGHGYPSGDGIQTMEDWRVVLDKMILGFEAQETLKAESPNNEERAILEAQWAEGSALFIKWYAALWD